MCQHHISYDDNFVPARDVMNDGIDFRTWYEFGPERLSRQQLEGYLKKNETEIKRREKQLYDVPDNTENCLWNAQYGDLILRFYETLELVFIMPDGDQCVHVILRQGVEGRYLHLVLAGIKGQFTFDVQEMRPEYLMNPHPRCLINIKCPFMALGFAKFGLYRMFLLAQMGGQAIFIELTFTRYFTFMEKNFSMDDL